MLGRAGATPPTQAITSTPRPLASQSDGFFHTAEEAEEVVVIVFIKKVIYHYG